MESYIDKRIQRSKQAIKAAFIECLTNKPFQQISVTEIIRASNYNRGTFYAHFESKEELLQEIIDDILREMIEIIRLPYKASKEVQLSQLNVEDIVLFKHFQDNANLYKLLLSNHIQVDFRHQLALAIEQLFIKEYDYKITSQALDLKWLYIFRAYGLAGMIIRWIEEDFKTPQSEMARQVVELMIVSTDSFRVKGQ